MSIIWPEQPDNEPIPRTNGHTYRLRRDFLYEDDRYFLKAFTGYLYDGASVPGIGTVLTGLHSDGLLRGPSVPHDMFYENDGWCTAVRPHPYFEIILKDGRERVLKPEADRLFYRMMIQAGVEREGAIMAYLAVRNFGLYPEDRLKHADNNRYND